MGKCQIKKAKLWERAKCEKKTFQVTRSNSTTLLLRQNHSYYRNKSFSHHWKEGMDEEKCERSVCLESFLEMSISPTTGLLWVLYFSHPWTLTQCLSFRAPFTPPHLFIVDFSHSHRNNPTHISPCWFLRHPTPRRLIPYHVRHLTPCPLNPTTHPPQTLPPALTATPPGALGANRLLEAIFIRQYG